MTSQTGKYFIKIGNLTELSKPDKLGSANLEGCCMEMFEYKDGFMRTVLVTRNIVLLDAKE